MPNIESITLENLRASNETSFGHGLVYHFAIKQNGVSLDFHLKQFFKGKELSFHFFDDFEKLVTICQRHQINVILVGGKSDFFKELELIQAIKQNVFLSIIPVILYHPEPSNETIIAAYENGAEDFIHGEWIEKLVEVRIQRVIARSIRDLSVNPSTRLPGPAMIEEEINRQLAMKATFAVCYADLDNFKAFNDYYGYSFGDKLIKLTGRIIRDTVFDTCREGFVGHIAGDDFIFIIPDDLISNVCGWIIKCFDAFAPNYYESEDIERGFITIENRKGIIESFPILSISIAVVSNSTRQFGHMGELSKILAELKRATKQLPGSNYMVDRRKDH
ncbi:MAG: diguanylate cyclase [candidate division Zixibacteria bacterium]|mgnify:CR=1 FL=1|nr:diguanylate cyclase [candidate division Zixibacteria bacterium]